MAKQTVGTTAALLDTSAYADFIKVGQVLLVQNLGPGIVYFDAFSGVTVGTGLQVVVNGWFKFPYQAEPLYVIASVGSTDLRFIAFG